MREDTQREKRGKQAISPARFVSLEDECTVDGAVAPQTNYKIHQKISDSVTLRIHLKLRFVCSQTFSVFRNLRQISMNFSSGFFNEAWILLEVASPVPQPN